jgi:hypothetical protein
MKLKPGVLLKSSYKTPLYLHPESGNSEWNTVINPGDILMCITPPVNRYGGFFKVLTNKGDVGWIGTAEEIV